ncbi:hypothetical protein QQX09_03665 [Demequina sp. SYSU T00192]|uniref:DUF1761 domain-containing protein n=1 Tax=Demequina litoralis TaxID=3051660 RepID=A0ABT8G747_9MICO|nr:hypothetical protein [Demequina sp. SYSU T00192]MDN4474951.1 hypothetical protein [Demequina sp. SYSU T00192]
MTTVETVAWATAAIFAAVALFQVALAAGAPWGRAAWGGAHEGALPGRLRAGSAVSAVMLLGMAAVVLAGAGAIGSGDSTLVTVLLWVVVAFTALSTLANLASRSPLERAIFGPTSIALLAGSLTVALAG